MSELRELERLQQENRDLQATVEAQKAALMVLEVEVGRQEDVIAQGRRAFKIIRQDCHALGHAREMVGVYTVKQKILGTVQQALIGEKHIHRAREGDDLCAICHRDLRDPVHRVPVDPRATALDVTKNCPDCGPVMEAALE